MSNETTTIDTPAPQSTTTLALVLESSPIVRVTNRHDDGIKLMPLQTFLVESQRSREAVHVGKDRAAETRAIKEKIGAWKDTHPDEWKQARDHYNAAKKEFAAAVRKMTKGNSTASCRKFRKSGTHISVGRAAKHYKG